MQHQQGLKNAKKVNLSQSEFQAKGSLNSDHLFNLYRVRLGDRSHFSIEVKNKGPKSNVDVEIYGLKQSHKTTLKQIGKTDFGHLTRKDKRRWFQLFGHSQKKGNSPETIDTELDQGIYYVRVYHQGKRAKYRLTLDQRPVQTDGVSHTASKKSSHHSTPDWFDFNLQTTSLQTTARSRWVDQSLGRSDMLNLFANVAEDGVVDQAELTDLQTIVAHHETLGMADHIRVLADKVVNGSNANTFYQGGTLGNLEVGRTGDHLNALVDKWFMGGDRPAAPEGYSMTYTQADGSLFGNDHAPSLDDIRQGYLADCYFLAALGANALHQPDVIRNMFIDNGDGTFTVKFYGQNNGKVTTEPDYVTVDRWLPTNVSDSTYNGQQFAAFDNGDRGLWVALAEKAYAQFAESAFSFRPLPINSYDGIQYGKGFKAMAAISGHDGQVYTNLSYGPAKVGDFPALDTIAQLFEAKTPVVLSTTSQPNLGLVADHQYVVTGADRSSQTLTLFNPHGDRTTPRPGETHQGFRTVSYSELATNFDTVEVQSGF